MPNGRETRLWKVLSGLTDPRRQASVEYPMPALLMILLMAKMSGVQTLRGAARFAKRHEQELKAMFSIASAPCFTALRHVLTLVSADELARLFCVLEGVAEGAVAAADGKTVRSSVRGGEGAGQTFAAALSVLDHATGRVLAAAGTSDGKKGEIGRLEAVLDDLEGLAALTADAQHCQKKR